MDTIYSLFQKVVKEHENAPAIIENDRAMTFGELSNMVDMITCSFPQEVHSIGIVMRHRTEMIASILAVLKCGGRYVPAEPDFPTGRIHDMMTEAQVDFVLTEHAFAPKLSSFPIRYTDCEICGVETPSWKCNAIEDPERPAYVLYTSGTTGRPKGVCVTNRNVCHYVRAFANEFHPGPGDVMLQYSVCSFDIFVEEVFTSLLNGAALAIPADEDKADIHALMAFCGTSPCDYDQRLSVSAGRNEPPVCHSVLSAAAYQRRRCVAGRLCGSPAEQSRGLQHLRPLRDNGLRLLLPL